MEDEYTLVRSPVIDKAKWIEKLKYDILRFSLDSVDLSLVEVGNALNVQVKIPYFPKRSFPIQNPRCSLSGRTSAFMHV